MSAYRREMAKASEKETATMCGSCVQGVQVWLSWEAVKPFWEKRGGRTLSDVLNELLLNIGGRPAVSEAAETESES